MNNELERMWGEMAVAENEVLSTIPALAWRD